MRCRLVNHFGHVHDTDVLVTTRRMRTGVLQDRAPLSRVGVLFHVEAPRPFALVFPDSQLLDAVPQRGNYVLVAPSGLPLGACIYQQVQLESDDGQPMAYTCMFHEYTDDECARVLFPRVFFCPVGDNGIHIADGMGECFYNPVDIPSRRTLTPVDPAPAPQAPTPQAPASHVREPSTCEPSAGEPSASGPSASGPSASGPSAAGPSAVGPSAAGPSVLHVCALCLFWNIHVCVCTCVCVWVFMCS